MISHHHCSGGQIFQAHLRLLLLLRLLLQKGERRVGTAEEGREEEGRGGERREEEGSGEERCEEGRGEERRKEKTKRRK